jgi:hypothetical protein
LLPDTALKRQSILMMQDSLVVGGPVKGGKLSLKRRNVEREEQKGGKTRAGHLHFPARGATVLYSLARLYEIAIQGATKGATECNISKEVCFGLTPGIPLKIPSDCEQKGSIALDVSPRLNA